LEERDEIYMRRCFELARKGLGITRSNPLVGCVIVHGDRIIGEGYHHEFGGPHAEVNAIRSVKDPGLFPASTLYCNMEPCAHHGKTPPCSALIIQKGIRKVVISNTDPFPSVNGLGIQQMRDAGVEVRTDCLEEEGNRLNRRFLHFHRKKKPYVILKWAQTQDGYIDLVREAGDPEGTNWITDEISRTLVHKWRSEEAAIMVGTNTVISDNPRLNLRRWTGDQPLRITFDRNGRLPPGARILDGSQETIVFTGVTGKYSGRTRSVHVDPSYEISDLLEELYDQQVISVLVEGGARLHQAFIGSGLWDEARVFTGKMKFAGGVRAPVIGKEPSERFYFRETLLEIYNNYDPKVQ
jgi:diaminohydroxyphosphoribosylaminopyrimidine deaminase/5-amino-6-(5-phosphoribosylamino)uracil reductase